MTADWRRDIAPVIAAIKAAIPAIVIVESDYGLTIGAMNPATGTAVWVAKAYRPERDGYCGHKWATGALVPTIIEQLVRQTAVQ